MSGSLTAQAMKKGGGIFRLAPAWVPRAFCRPGRRLKLHPDDYFALGLSRGGIDERWLSSTTNADNGPGTPPDEGLSYVVPQGGDRFLLRDAIADGKAEVIGDALWDKYGKLPMYSKFFDNLGPLPHHIHHGDKHAALTGQMGKPEMYFFPSQMNNYGGEFPFTFFGIIPGTERAAVKACLQGFAKGDNKLLQLAQAYKLTVDTGWDVPTGILHAPGSLCTYEPQFASDVFSMFQSLLLGDHAVDESLLWRNTPPDRLGDYDWLMEILDWELNTSANFYAERFMPPVAVGDTLSKGWQEERICYKCPLLGAKRLTLLPGAEAVIRDEGAYGMIMLEGYGTMKDWTIETPAQIRYGQPTNDEFFVTAAAARDGVLVRNLSSAQPLVMLKHFAII